MAACLSIKAGNWNDPSVWSTGEVPADGDTATINHAVTVTGSHTVGHSPGTTDATAAILVNGTAGSLTIDGGTLVCRGDLRLHNAPLACNGAGVLEFDASQAASPSTALYRLQISTANAQAGAKLVVLGTDNSNRFTIRSNSGGANARISGGNFTRGGKHDIRYCNLLRIGNATNPAIGNCGTASADPFKVYDSTFTNCGALNVTVGTGHLSQLERVRCKFVGGLNSSGRDIDEGGSGTIGAGGSRRIERCSFTGTLRLSGPSNYTLIGNVVDPVAGFVPLSFTATRWASWEWNLVTSRSASPPVAATGDYANSYLFKNHLASNPHGMTLGSTGLGGVVVSGSIFDYLWTFTDGDLTMANGLGDSQTHTITGCILLPNANGRSPGTIHSALGNANCNTAFTHNTYVADTGGGATAGELGIRYGETYAGHAGMFPEVRSNLAFAFNLGQAAIFGKVSAGTTSVPDGCLAANVSHNAGHNLATRNAGLGYFSDGTNPLWSGSPGGANDVGEVDPQFVDCSPSGWRCLALFDTDYLGNTAPAWSSGQSYAVGDIVSNAVPTRWGGRVVNYRCIAAHAGSTANSQPGSGSSWATHWELASLWRLREGVPLYEYTPGVPWATVEDLVRWVRAGFAPRNAALRDAGHDGATIGAVAFAAGDPVAAPGKPPRFFFARADAVPATFRRRAGRFRAKKPL